MPYNRENRPPLTLLPPGTPIKAHSPSAKPLLAQQRDHSACRERSSSPLVRETPLSVARVRGNSAEVFSDVPPPCQGCPVNPAPQRQRSVSRRVISAVRQSLSRVDTSQRSISNVAIDVTTDVESYTSIQPPVQPSIVKSMPTQLQIPYIDLQVNIDSDRVDVNDKQDVWISIAATAKLRALDVSSTEKQVIGEIPALRLLFRPAPKHRILQTLGDVSAKDMKLGDTCDLFVRLRVPKHESADSSKSEFDTIMSDLESTLGVLKTEVLYIEARYQHTMFDENNSVVIYRKIKISRHQPNSR